MKHLNNINSYINENLSQAKAILRRNGLNQEDPNFIKLKELCSEKIGWLGLLTKMFYEFKINFGEIEEIYSALKNGSHDLGKLNRMSYEEISDLVYNTELESSKDYELLFNINGYRYYKILNYDGILQIGSPTWCLKTGSNWRNYVKAGWSQYVIIKEGIKLLTPKTNYLSNYQNRGNSLIRLGVTIKDDLSDFIAFDDNNSRVDKSTHINILLKKLKGENVEGLDLTDVVVLIDNSNLRLLYPKNKEAFEKISKGVWKYNDDCLYYFIDSKKTNFMIDELVELDNNLIYVYDSSNTPYSLSPVKSFDSHDRIRDGLRELCSYIYNNRTDFKRVPNIIGVASIHFGFRTEEDFLSKNGDYHKYEDYFCQSYKSNLGYYCTSFVHKNLENYPYSNFVLGFRKTGIFKHGVEFYLAITPNKIYKALPEFIDAGSDIVLPMKLYEYAKQKALEMIKKK